MASRPHCGFITCCGGAVDILIIIIISGVALTFVQIGRRRNTGPERAAGLRRGSVRPAPISTAPEGAAMPQVSSEIKSCTSTASPKPCVQQKMQICKLDLLQWKPFTYAWKSWPQQSQRLGRVVKNFFWRLDRPSAPSTSSCSCSGVYLTVPNARRSSPCLCSRPLACEEMLDQHGSRHEPAI